MTPLAIQIQKLESACAGLLELMMMVPSEPQPLRAYVKLSTRLDETVRNAR